MPKTYTPLATTTLSSAAASVTFSSINGSYTDLVLIVNGTVNTGSYFTLRFNSDSGNNYSNTEIYQSGNTPGSARNTNNPYMYNGSVGTTQTTVINHIQNYSNSTTNKTVLTRSNVGGSEVKVSIGLWRSTSAITSVTCGTGGSNTYQSGSTFTLYGILAA